MSRGLMVLALGIAVVIMVALYIYGRSGSPPEVTRTSGPEPMETTAPNLDSSAGATPGTPAPPPQ